MVAFNKLLYSRNVEFWFLKKGMILVGVDCLRWLILNITGKHVIWYSFTNHRLHKTSFPKDPKNTFDVIRPGEIVLSVDEKTNKSIKYLPG